MEITTTQADIRDTVRPPGTQAMSSTYDIVNIERRSDGDLPEVTVEVFDSITRDTTNTLACRVIVTSSDGSHPDGGDQGVYADGRFFSEGRFAVQVPVGLTEILIRKGPAYVPLRANLDVTLGQCVHLRVWLHRWFSPEDLGWYGGDNHVHSQHDVTAFQKTGLYYTALQGRANGLSFITESGSHVSYDNIDQLSTTDFLLRYAEELGPVCYTGHLITPGITVPFTAEQLDQMSRAPLFTQRVVEAADLQGAAVTYTHPLTPIHQVHWMGATEAFSDAVMGQCAHLFDIDSKATELMWFALLNLGNRIGASSYTDSTLERLNTLTPGDRRVYCHSKVLEYPAIVEALRQGRTFSANGSVFAFFSINSHEPGDVIRSDREESHTARVEIHSLYPLKRVELYRNGNVVADFDVVGQTGMVTLERAFRESEDSWYVVRVEDDDGHWCITSPIYFESPMPVKTSAASAIVFEISNHTRFAYIERDYFAHVVVTVSPADAIAEVQLLKDCDVHASFLPEAGDLMPSGRIPVTESEEGVPYEQGWLWYPSADRKLHFQLDYSVFESGKYAVCIKTVSGNTILSDAIHFDYEKRSSQSLSVAHLKGNKTDFVLSGYGEETLIENPSQAREDRWWYPQNTAWRVTATFDGQTYELSSDASDVPHKRVNN